MRKIFILLAGLLPLSISAQQLPPRLTLPLMVELAQKHNPGLKRIQQQVREQDGVIDELYAARKLKFNLLGNGSQEDEGRTQAFGDFSPETTAWDLTAEARMTVYSGGRSMAIIRMQKQRLQSLSHTRAVAEQKLIADVHEAYLQAQLAREQITVQEEVLRVLGEQLKFSRNRLDAGVGEPFDVMQAEVAQANARPELIRARNNYRRKIETLRQTTGLSFPPGIDAKAVLLTPAELNENLPFDLEGALEQALAFRPEIVELNALEKTAQLQYDAVTLEQRPVVDVFADYGAKSDDFGAEDYLHGWKTGLMFTVPIGDGGKTKSRKQQADALLKQVKHDRETMEIQITGEVRQAFYDYEEAQSILATSGQVTETAEEALRLARNRYRAGKGTQLDVLEAQLQLTESIVEDVTALNTLQRAVVKIKRAAGIAL